MSFPLLVAVLALSLACLVLLSVCRSLRRRLATARDAHRCTLDTVLTAVHRDGTAEIAVELHGGPHDGHRDTIPLSVALSCEPLLYRAAGRPDAAVYTSTGKFNEFTNAWQYTLAHQIAPSQTERAT